MYFAILSVLDAEPVLISPVFIATAKSAIKVSSVSPDLWDEIDLIPCSWAILIASSVSDTVPIWLSLIKIELAIPFSIPIWSLEIFVTKRSSPTSIIFSPKASVNFFHPSKSSSAIPSSIEIIGYFWHQSWYKAISSSAFSFLPSPARS